MRQPKENLGRIAGIFLRLGCVSFGGPVAHLGYLRTEFVVRRAWLSEEEYSDLVALCQFLPGPASSQVVYGLGYRRAGLAGGLLASFCFLLPSATLMLVFAAGIAGLGSSMAGGWLHGLKLAAVAVVAQAVLGMGLRLCPDIPRFLLGIVATVIVLAVPGYEGQVAAMLVGALVGLGFGGTKGSVAVAPERQERGHTWALGSLCLYAGLLVALPLLAAGRSSGWLVELNVFYRAGALVFGGGHVILPLLREGTVGLGGLTDETFLAGYGAAQAVPGPLFSFAAFLGASMHRGPGALFHGILCLAAIYLPALLLVGGALPFWGRLREKHWMQSAMRGTNAAVVGLLLAALINPIASQGLVRGMDYLIVVVLFVLLQGLRLSPWFVVLVAALAGQWSS